MSAVTSSEQEVARAAIELQVRLNEIQEELNSKKEELRVIANGKKKEIIVTGLGKVNISAPFEGKETQVLVFDEARLNEIPELRHKLIEKGVAREEIKKVPATAAKVTIKPNV